MNYLIKNNKYIMLIDWDNCSSEYITCGSKEECNRRMRAYKRNPKVESVTILSNPNIVGGWYLWKNWNGVSLDELRKKI